MFDADSKAIQQINFTANLDQQGQTAMCFIIEDAKKKKHFRFFIKNYKNIVIFCLI